jgi:F-type H+-transporting ATPase subunit epsilon
MSELINFNLVSPERRLSSSDALSIIIPGADGELTALPNHAPLVTSIRPGILVVNKSDGNDEFIVTGGFAEISESGTNVLAEKSIPKAEVNQEFLDVLLKHATDEVETATYERQALANLKLNDVKVLISFLK